MKQGFLAKPNCDDNQILTRAAKKRPKPKPPPPPPAVLPPSPYNFTIPLEIQSLVDAYGPKSTGRTDPLKNVSNKVKSRDNLRIEEADFPFPDGVPHDPVEMFSPAVERNTDANVLSELLEIDVDNILRYMIKI